MINWQFYHTDGSVVNAYCGNGISCCEVCKGYNDEEFEKSSCLTLMFDSITKNQSAFDQATDLCDLMIKDDPNYCHNLPEGKVIYLTLFFKLLTPNIFLSRYLFRFRSCRISVNKTKSKKNSVYI